MARKNQETGSRVASWLNPNHMWTEVPLVLPFPEGRIVRLSHRATDGHVPPLRKYTAKQGQYLAFIYYYTKIRGLTPSEAEMQRYFGVTPPAVHTMILGLERSGLITRTPGAARSIRLVLTRTELPDLE